MSKFLSSPRINTILYHGIVLLLSLYFAVNIYNQDSVGDTSWEIRDGLDQLARGGVSRSETMTWTFYGHEWVPNSWLFNLIWGWLFKTGGVPLSFVIIPAIISFAIFMIIWVVIHNYVKLPNIWKLIIFGATSYALLGWLTPARPQIFDYLIAVGFLWIILAINRSKKIKSPLKEGLLFVIGYVLLVIWQNFHLTGIVGIALFCLFFFLFLPAPVASNLFFIRRRLLFAVITGVVYVSTLFLTPYGLDGVVKPIIVAQQSTHIVEWLSAVQLLEQNSLSIDVVCSIMVLILIFLVFLIYKKNLGMLITGIVLVVSIFMSSRFIPYLLIIVIATLAVQSFPLLEHPPFGGISKLFTKESKIGKIITAMLLVVLNLLFLFMSVNEIISVTNRLADGTILSHNSEDFAVIPAGQRVFNGLDGIVELYRPDTYSLEDGRNDLFGDEFIGVLYKLQNSNDTEKVSKCLVDEAVNVVVWLKIVPLSSGLEGALSGWTEISTSKHYNIYLRPVFLDVPSPSYREEVLAKSCYL